VGLKSLKSLNLTNVYPNNNKNKNNNKKNNNNKVKSKPLELRSRVKIRVLIFRFQLLAVYVLLVHNCGECRISNIQNLMYCLHLLVNQRDSNTNTNTGKMLAVLPVLRTYKMGTFDNNYYLWKKIFGNIRPI
jgi:hypothetical protein